MFFIIRYRAFFLFIYFFILQSASYSQFYFFGRNKVRYEEFKWKVFETENFEIYYDQNFEEIARIGSAYAEDAYKDLSEKFENIIITKIPLIFYNTPIHFQQTNVYPGLIPDGVGGFYEFLKGRVVIPFNGSISDFMHVIKHELVHVFTLNKIYRVFKDRRIYFNRYPPLWFIEGLAEYWSTEWDWKGEMILRDAVEKGYFVDLKNFWKISGSFLMYKMGQKFLEFVSINYGEDKILRLFDNFWLFEDFNDNLAYTLNENFEDLNLKWIDYLKKSVYKNYSQTLSSESHSIKITRDGFNFSPSLIKNGDNFDVVFLANRDGYSSIYSQSISPKTLRPEKDIELLIRGEKNEQFESFYFLQNIIRTNQNGDVIFVSRSGSADVIYLYSLREKEIKKKIKFENLIAIDCPNFVDDSERIVFSAMDRRGFKDIYIYDINKDELISITQDYFCDEYPVYSKEYNAIFFVTDRSASNFNKSKSIYAYNFQKNIAFIVYKSDGEISNLVFNDQRKSLFFLADYEGVKNVYELKLNSEKDIVKSATLTRVTNFFSGISSFDLEDNILIYSTYVEGSFQLYALKLDDHEKIRQTNVITNQMTDNEIDSLSLSLYVPKKLDLKGYSKDYSVKKKYSVDFAQSQVSIDPVFGTQSGAAVFLSDMLGDDQYYILVYNTAEVQSEFLKSLNIAIARFNYENRVNYSYGIFHFSGRRYDIRDKDEYYYERSFGASASFLYPLSRFRRIEFNFVIANSDKQIISQILERKALIISAAVSFVSDNSIWAFTGPIDGHRFRVLLGYTRDIRYDNVNYLTGIFDYRYYARISFKSLLAIRNSIYYNQGKETRRYIAGGSWDLRGWQRWSLRGEKLWVTSFELRFPLIDLAYFKFPWLDVGLPNIRGAAFFDVGSVWDKKYEETLGSIGYGFRFNLFNAVVLRYDIGKKIINNFTKLQNGTFYQFFFGWDF